MALKFNNNREFFDANRKLYEDCLRDPARALADELGEAVRQLDPTLETRPHKVVSRINRDTRFSNDKSPYRDFLWIAFRRPGVERCTTLGVFFDIGVSGTSYGMGYYDENRPMMNALRRQILMAPEHVQALTERALTRFAMFPKAYKRMAIPEGVPEPLKPWYALKGFYVEKEIKDFDLICSPALLDEIRDGFLFLKPFYDFLTGLVPEDDDYGGAPQRTRASVDLTIDPTTMKEG